jgi:hypothetical protein
MSGHGLLGWVSYDKSPQPQDPPDLPYDAHARGARGEPASRPLSRDRFMSTTQLSARDGILDRSAGRRTTPSRNDKDAVRRAREEPARRARRRRTKPARDTAPAGAASRSLRGVRFMPARVGRALDGTLDPARRPLSATSWVGLSGACRPSAMARAISCRTTSRTTPDRPPRQTPRRRPDREVGEG